MYISTYVVCIGTKIIEMSLVRKKIRFRYKATAFFIDLYYYMFKKTLMISNLGDVSRRKL